MTVASGDLSPVVNRHCSDFIRGSLDISKIGNAILWLCRG